MSKIKGTRKIPATKQEYISHIKCDLCGEEQKYDYRGWDANMYEYTEVKVQLSECSNFPEGGSKESLVYDICPKCFKEKLMAWFEEQGVRPAEEYLDW